MYATIVYTALSLVLPQEAPPFETDRPDFTEGSHTVGRGTFQVEGGFTVVSANDELSGAAPELLLRYGIGERSELRFTLPDWHYADSDAGARGFGDPTIGAKIEVPESSETLDFAFIAAASLPLGEDGIGAEGTIIEGVFTWSHESSGLAGQVGAAAPLDSDDGEPVFQHTIVYGADLPNGNGWFAELASEFSDGARPVHLGHMGVTMPAGASSQFDIHFGTALFGDGPDWFIGAGYSTRL